MAVPKHRTSVSKKNMRRSHHALKAGAKSFCPNCGNIKRPHYVCESCGHHKGKQVLEPRRMSSADLTSFDAN